MRPAPCKLGELPSGVLGFTTMLTHNQQGGRRRGILMPPRDARTHPDGVRVGMEALARPAGQGEAFPTPSDPDDPNSPWPVERWLHRNVIVRPGWDE